MVETLVAVTISGLLFAWLGFLVFVAARNMHNVRDQVVGQTSAAAANEFAVSQLRNATYFARHPADSGATEDLKRILFVEPMQNGIATTRALALNAATRELRYYDSLDSLQLDSDGNAVGTPARVYRNISDFRVSWLGQYRIRMTTGFNYHGFAFAFDTSRGRQTGHLTTDVIAKNHYLDQGVESHANDTGTSGPATL